MFPAESRTLATPAHSPARSPQIPLPSWRNGSKKGPIWVIRLDGRSKGLKVIDRSLVRSLKSLISHPRFPPSSCVLLIADFYFMASCPHVSSNQLPPCPLQTSANICKRLQTSVDRVKELLAAAHGDLFTQEEIRNNKQRRFGSSADDRKGLEKCSPGRRD